MDRQRYLNLIELPILILEKKNRDYNSDTALKDYFPFGDKSYAHEIHKKALRIKNLVQQAPHGGPEFESISDSLHDLINYAVYYLDYIEEGGSDV